MAGKKGMKHARPRTPKDRDGYAASRIEQLLDDAREGKVTLDASKLKAIEIRYSRLRPMLSAIEQTNVDPRDKADPAALESQLVALLNEKPEILERLLELRRQASATQPVVGQTHSGSNAIQ